MLAIISRRKIWYLFSGLMVSASVLALIFWGLKPGIDFTGGSLAEIKFVKQQPTNVQEITAVLSAVPVASPSAQAAENNTYLVRTGFLSEEEHQKVLTKLNEKFGQVEEVRFETIGPTIGQELRTKSIYAVIVVLLAIITYIAYAFRKVSTPLASWKYGVAAVIALIHDVTIVMGVFAILGHFFGVEVDTMFVTALLTVLGFSVHDTIVVFDRTRYNLLGGEHDEQSFSTVVNDSVNQTLVRSINTSLTTFIVLLAIYLLGGETTKWFVFALLIGIIVGTYSSIFVASTLIVSWERFDRRRKLAKK